MGANTRGFANLLNTDGTFLSGAINNTSISGITDLPTAAKSDLVLISSQTASASASISFTSGIDSTYDAYCFKFINMHPATDLTDLKFQGSTNGGSSYGVTITNTNFHTYHGEGGAGGVLTYNGDNDLAQSTNYAKIGHVIGNDNDQNSSGELWLFNPSNTTYVKHFFSRISGVQGNDYEADFYNAGYFNTTSAINAIDFKMSSGNMDDGTIYLYGLK